MHPESAYESITHPNAQTNLRNHVREDATLYTERNHSTVAGIEGRREDKHEACYWAARESRGGSKNCHVVRFKVKHNHGNLQVSLSSHAVPVSERSTSLLFSSLSAWNQDN